MNIIYDGFSCLEKFNSYLTVSEKLIYTDCHVSVLVLRSYINISSIYLVLH